MPPFADQHRPLGTARNGHWMGKAGQLLASEQHCGLRHFGCGLPSNRRTERDGAEWIPLDVARVLPGFDTGGNSRLEVDDAGVIVVSSNYLPSMRRRVPVA